MCVYVYIYMYYIYIYIYIYYIYIYILYVYKSLGFPVSGLACRASGFRVYRAFRDEVYLRVAGCRFRGLLSWLST